MTTQEQKEYQEYIDTEKEALRQRIKRSRYLPGIPLHDIAQILVDELDWHEIQVLAHEMIAMATERSRIQQKKGGDDV